jgi:hypothetical protein
MKKKRRKKSKSPRGAAAFYTTLVGLADFAGLTA